MKITKNMYVEDTAASRELELYADNESNIYFNHIKPVISNLQKKYVKGRFDGTKAIVAFYHVATAASNKYFKEFGYKFSVTERWTAAYNLLQNYMEEIEESGDE